VEPKVTKIPLTKVISMEVPNGYLEIQEIGDTKYVWYHNGMYKDSPFKCSVSYGLSWSDYDIRMDSEVLKFIKRITGE
jgi:hypothetical protein